MNCGNAVLAHALRLKDTPFDQHNHSHEVTTPYAQRQAAVGDPKGSLLERLTLGIPS
jgi:hypothetical protein